MFMQMYDIGLPTFMSETLEELNIGTYHDIATVCRIFITFAQMLDW